MNDLMSRLYPELAAGGFTRDSHWLIFFSRVNALVREGDTVVDFGAGRAEWVDRTDPYRVQLGSFEGKCARFIGVDVDPAVLSNRLLDEALLINENGAIPLPDASVDLIYSWAVFEHVTDPERTASELARILKPGGWLCAWTPNKYSYVGIGVRLLPNRLHFQALRKLGMAGGAGQRQEQDVFSTFYRLNTRGALEKYFPKSRFDHFSYTFAGPPTHSGNSRLLAGVWRAWARFMPASTQAAWHIFIRKR